MYKDKIEDLNLFKKNYKGKYIPVMGGIILIIVSVFSWYLIYLLNYLNTQIINANIFITVIIGLTGLLDDIMGNKESQGFKGHLKTLLKGRLTTGVIKIIITFLVTVIILLKMGTYNIIEIVINTAVILLMTNLLNLLDLRPGRSIKFFIFTSVCLISRKIYAAIYFFPYYLILLFYLPHEMKGRVMLGDSGANLLGAVLGFNIILLIDYFYIKVSILLLLIFFNLISEKYSFSTIIQKNPFLKWIDELGRKDGYGE